ncbi:MAG: hypothetical protein EXQ90_05830 [Rhodospirillales bacterium]|nr:hypothetical protein [Rhodospirillales bacterium]
MSRVGEIARLCLCIAGFAIVAMGLVPGAAPTAQAAVMSFSGIGDGCPGIPNDPYTESGITARGTSDGLSSWTRPGSAHLDTGGSTCPSGVEFTTGGLFDAISAEIFPLTPTAYCSEAGTECSDPYENVLWQGFVGGVVVASDQFWMGDGPSTYAFGDAFRGLDKLVVRILLPNVATVGGWCFDSPCSHFDLDNVTLALLPAPMISPMRPPAGAVSIVWASWRTSESLSDPMR